MQLIRRLCLLCFFFAIHSGVRAQDTLSLFYMTARYQLTDVHRAQIGRFLNTLDQSQLDSVQIIGVADSTGNQRANERLSLRRASQVERFLKDNGFNLPTRLLAKGEDHDALNSLEKQRRVDIIFFANSPEEYEESLSSEVISKIEADSVCYIFADQIIVEGFETIIQKGKKSYVQLEIDASIYTDSVKYFMVREDPKTKKPNLKAIKWKKMVTGDEWWRKTRYIALIPKEDYTRARIVRESKEDCDTIPEDCGFRLSDTEVRIKTEKVLVPAMFLLQNTRVKRKVFKRRFFRIEVPKQYVSSETYYFDESGKYPVEWFTKKGKKKRNCYYANVREELLENGELMIYTYFPVTTCFEKERYCRHAVGIQCGTGNNRDRVTGKTSLGVEVGNKNVQPTHFGYIGLYAKRTWNSAEWNGLLGIDVQGSGLFSLRFDEHFLGLLPFGSLGKTNVYAFKTISLYAGSTADVIYSDQQNWAFNQDLHLGIDLTFPIKRMTFHRIFLEGGAMVGFVESASNVRPQFRLGAQFRF